MDVRHPPNLGRTTVHVPDQQRKGALIALVVVLYAVALQWSWATSGDPYSVAVDEARRVHDRFVKEEALKPKKVEWVEDHDEDMDIDHVDADEKPKPGGWDASAEDSEDSEDPEDEGSSQGDGSLAKNEDGSDSGTNSTMEAKLKKALPSESLPSAGAASFLFIVISGHILFHLLCYWHPAFKAASLFKPASSVTEGAYVLVRTLPHHGKPGLSKLTRNSITDELMFDFQRRRYKYISQGMDDIPDLVGDFATGAVMPVSSKIDKPLKEYVTKGLDTSAVSDLFKVYGENRLSIVPPTLFTMWRQQLISPIPVFQFFCSVLWMLDEYWQYTVFTFITIMMLEGGTAFQRLRTLSQLTKMSMKPYPVMTLRGGKWMEISTQELLPGDIISLNVAKAEKVEKDKAARDVLGDVVPCDCLMLQGSAVVNEASLTGESIPAMKDAIPATEDAREPLAMEGKHRIHTLFSGTSLVDVKQGQGELSGVPTPPNKGCVCHVLRTGFGSSQGSLMQLIEFSTEGVAGDTKETFLALLLLLFFAIIAAVYVFQKGLEKGDRTTHELLIKSVLIITSVVPRQLPMQMALAVNTALMALVKSGIMCTEPFRVPLAGKISHTLFDKTGTLTTDTLVPAGVINASDKTHELLPVNKADRISCIILAGCHSLVAVGDDANIVGDPIEVAAIHGIEWRYDAKKQTAYRGNWEAKERSVADTEKELKAYKEGTKKHRELTELLAKQQKEAKRAKEAAKDDNLAVHIKHRFHFSSQLQRMCTTAEVTGLPNGGKQHYCLVKGSPEAIMKLVDDNHRPEWFESKYIDLMEKGMRVLALAYKVLPDSNAKPEREKVESGLTFAGFIAFSCRIRNDSKAVIGALGDSSHTIAMVTGDGPLTALHVAKEVGICGIKPAYVLEVGGGKAEWVTAIGKDKERRPVELGDKLSQFAATAELMSTEENLEKAADVLGDDFWKEVTHFSVFARMSPPGKAKVIRSLQDHRKAHVLMCGDGSNDVGALKQADVGLALLSGYGNANTGDSDSKDEDSNLSAEEKLNKHQKEMDKKAAKATAVKRELMGQKQKEIAAKQKEWLEEELKAREERGEPTGVMGQMAAMKVVLKRFQDEMKKEEKEVSKVGNVYAPTMNDALAAAEMDTLMIRPGDASVAASFTSRLPTIKSTVDLIRQGRCTLLSALQQQQIMMLESLIQAFTLSALSLEGARQSERQMMASGWLLSIATIAFSYATPLDKMHPARPLRSLFHPAIFVSMAGQAIIHIYCMHQAVTMSTDAMGPEELAAVVEFHRKARANEVIEEPDPEDPLAFLTQTFWATPFKPNLLNTVVFLVETAQIVAVLFVNYKGRPWMKGVTENHALFLSLFTSFAGIAYVAWGFSPEMNAMFHFAPFPDDAFRWRTIELVSYSVFGTLIWDRIATAIFAPHIFKIMVEEVLATRLTDIIPIFKTLGKVLGGFIALSTINPLLLMGGYYMYRNMNKKQLGDD